MCGASKRARAHAGPTQSKAAVPSLPPRFAFRNMCVRVRCFVQVRAQGVHRSCSSARPGTHTGLSVVKVCMQARIQVYLRCMARIGLCFLTAFAFRYWPSRPVVLSLFSRMAGAPAPNSRLCVGTTCASTRKPWQTCSKCQCACQLSKCQTQVARVFKPPSSGGKTGEANRPVGASFA